MKNNNFKKILILAVICFGLNQMSLAQCNASFTFTASTSGVSATSTSTGTTAATNYGWNIYNSNGANVASSGGTSAVFNSLYNGTYTVSLSIWDSLSGANCNSANNQIVTISGGQNAPACSASFTYTTGSTGQVICTNTSPSDPYNHTNYTWYFGSNDTIASTQASSTYTYYYNGTYTISLSANNSVDGCSTTSATQTVTISNATTPPACNANFTYTVGSAGQVSFTSLYAGIAPDTTHQWDFGDGSRYDAPTITHTYYPNGTYTVTLYVSDAANACYASSSQTVSISNAVTPCAPTVNFIVHKDSLNPQPGVWEISSYYSSQVTSAVWNWGDGTSTIGFAPTHTYAIVGQYNICVMVFSSCGDSSYVCQNDSLYRTNSGMIAVTVLNVNATGISKNLNLNNQITVYPNPSTGLFTLNLSNTAATKAQISISNILGEVVFNSQEQINNNAFTKEMDMQHLANGAYFMKVSVGNKTFSSKLIISK